MNDCLNQVLRKVGNVRKETMVIGDLWLEADSVPELRPVTLMEEFRLVQLLFEESNFNSTSLTQSSVTSNSFNFSSSDPLKIKSGSGTSSFSSVKTDAKNSFKASAGYNVRVHNTKMYMPKSGFVKKLRASFPRNL